MTRHDASRRKAGFTLIETLVALSLLLAFATAFTPLMFQARHILTQTGDDIGAQVALRAALAEPFNGFNPETGVREGASGSMSWTIDVEPYGVPHALASTTARQRQPAWALFKVIARVSLGNGRAISGETLRLGRVP